MGSYAHLSLGGYELASTKSFVDPTAMMLFTERDKRIRMPEPGDVVVDSLGEEYDATPEVEYVASLAIVRDRLEFMGYTLARVRKEFKEGIDNHIEETTRQIEYTSSGSDEVRRLLLPKYQEALVLLQSVTFDDWLDAIGFIFRGKHYPSTLTIYPD
jgi:hypothetical protein